MVGQEPIVATLRNAVATDKRRARAPVRRAARHRQDLDRAHPGQGDQLHRPAADGEPCDRCPACVSIREGRAMDVVEIDAASTTGVEDVRDS